jgi:hypothetical protein
MSGNTLTDTYNLLEKEVSGAYLAIIVCTAILLLVGIITIFCIYKIGQVITYYRRQNAELNISNMTASKAASSADTDNVPPPEDINVSYDDASRFNTNFEKTVAEFKSYNEQLKKYYAENYPGEEPKDLLDRSILDPHKDNY